jgi:hypothetical protein
MGVREVMREVVADAWFGSGDMQVVRAPLLVVQVPQYVQCRIRSINGLPQQQERRVLSGGCFGLAKCMDGSWRRHSTCTVRYLPPYCVVGKVTHCEHDWSIGLEEEPSTQSELCTHDEGHS